MFGQAIVRMTFLSLICPPYRASLTLRQVGQISLRPLKYNTLLAYHAYVLTNYRTGGRVGLCWALTVP